MPRLLDTQAYLDAVCEMLQQGETSVVVPVAGDSMTPFLHHGDTVYLDLPGRPLKRGDIVLYTRAGGRYILHRIYKVNKDGSFLMVGDAQQVLEKIPSRGQIHALVTSARHEGKLIRPGQPRWWVYQHIWMWLLPHRYRLMHLRGKFNKKQTGC